jgi:uncharacterized spore protein YtfJ
VSTKRGVVDSLRSAVGAGRVFGEPVERDGVVVIPAATVIGGGGGGEGDQASAEGEEESAKAAGRGPRSGSGMGFGLVAWPSGAIEIRDGHARWRPAIDVTRLAIASMFFGLLALRTIVRARAR